MHLWLTEVVCKQAPAQLKSIVVSAGDESLPGFGCAGREQKLSKVRPVGCGWAVPQVDIAQSIVKLAYLVDITYSLTKRLTIHHVDRKHAQAPAIHGCVVRASPEEKFWASIPVGGEGKKLRCGSKKAMPMPRQAHNNNNA